MVGRSRNGPIKMEVKDVYVTMPDRKTEKGTLKNIVEQDPMIALVAETTVVLPGVGLVPTVKPLRPVPRACDQTTNATSTYASIPIVCDVFSHRWILQAHVTLHKGKAEVDLTNSNPSMHLSHCSWAYEFPVLARHFYNPITGFTL